jgi:hypothetical protein
VRREERVFVKKEEVVGERDGGKEGKRKRKERKRE